MRVASTFLRRCGSRGEFLLNNMRSLLFVPGNSMKMLQKTLTLQGPSRPDAIIPDLEDSIPLAEKSSARATVSDFLSSTEFPENMVVIPRVNFVDGMLEEDLKAVLVTQSVVAVNIGKTQTIEDVLLVSDFLASIEDAMPDWELGRVKVLPTIESPLGLVNAYDICRCSDRIIGLSFGADDYANEMGFTRHELGTDGLEQELNYVRNGIAVAARACGIQAVDSPNVNFRNLDGVSLEALGVKRMGMSGKMAIHPSQIEPINEVFSVSDEHYEYACRLLEAYYEEVEGHGRGSFDFEGKMVDTPVVKQHENLVRLYEIRNSVS